jgi:DNA modification methylase
VAVLELLTIKIQQMNIESTNDNNSTNPAITYSECYAQPFLLFNESNLDTMKRMPDCFVDLTVTSPPYDNLRDYKGYSFPFEEIAKELFRVTKQGGVLVWVVGDATVNGSETGTSFKQALYFMQCGFLLHDTMIYEKCGVMPSKTRYCQMFEYMFVFSKGKPKTTNIIKDRKNNWGNTNTGNIGQRQKDGSIKKNGIKTISEFGSRFNIWRIMNEGGFMNKDKETKLHPATFPMELANDHILSWSNEGDIVYDCFAGSGTTGKMAILNKRKCIMSEISSEYCEIIKKRLEPIINERTLF